MPIPEDPYTEDDRTEEPTWGEDADEPVGRADRAEEATEDRSSAFPLDAEEVSSYDEDDTGPAAARRSQILFVGAICAWTAWAWIKWGLRPPPPVPAAVVAQPDDEAPAPADPDAHPPASDVEAVPSAASASEETASTQETVASPPAGEVPAADEGAAPSPGRIVPGPPAKDWPSRFSPPKVVTYTIRNGGTLENVANLHKIFHHEIKALNPGVPFDKELPPGTKVVVYRAERAKPSASIGYPGDGALEGAVPMPDGPGRILKMIPWKSWGTAWTVAVIDDVLRTWSERRPDALPILVGNLSAPTGGRLEPHSTHQSGRDVDLGYPQKPGVEKEYNWREMDARLLDAEGAWALLEILAETRAIEVVFIDRAIQKLLYDHAVATGRYTKGQLARWMEYPRPTGSGSPFIQHVPGHVDHLHVRVACHPDDGRCKSRPR